MASCRKSTLYETRNTSVAANNDETMVEHAVGDADAPVHCSLVAVNVKRHTHTDTHLLLAVLRQARCEVIHVSSVGEDAGHALPQQLVSVDLCSSGSLLLFPAPLCDPQPPSIQHLQEV